MEPEVHDLCAVEAWPLPDEAPRRSACPEGTELEICFDLENAWRLDELLESLYSTWQDAKECEARRTNEERP